MKKRNATKIMQLNFGTLIYVRVNAEILHNAQLVTRSITTTVNVSLIQCEEDLLKILITKEAVTNLMLHQLYLYTTNINFKKK